MKANADKIQQAKPIFIVKIPDQATTDQFNKIRKSLNDQFADYHVIVHQSNISEPKFEAFYPKDFTPIQFDELKDIVNKEYESRK